MGNGPYKVVNPNLDPWMVIFLGNYEKNVCPVLVCVEGGNRNKPESGYMVTQC